MSLTFQVWSVKPKAVAGVVFGVVVYFDLEVVSRLDVFEPNGNRGETTRDELRDEVQTVAKPMCGESMG